MNNVFSATAFSIAKRLRMYLIIALLFWTGSSIAQNNNDSFIVERARSNYLIALNTENESLQQSAIFNVMALQQYYPGYDYNKIIETLHDLSINSDNPAVRYKAFLAFNFFKNNGWFGKYDFLRQPEPERVFRSIADTINDRLLTVSRN